MRADELPDTIEGINAAQKAERTRRRWATYQRIEDFLIWISGPLGLTRGVTPGPTRDQVAETQRSAAKRRSARDR